jgi:hypothetical protein
MAVNLTANAAANWFVCVDGDVGDGGDGPGRWNLGCWRWPISGAIMSAGKLGLHGLSLAVYAGLGKGRHTA